MWHSILKILDSRQFMINLSLPLIQLINSSTRMQYLTNRLRENLKLLNCEYISK